MLICYHSYSHFSLQALAGVEAPQPCDGTIEPQVLDIQTYLSSLPLSAHPRLELQLDSDHNGVEIDLYQIAHHMVDWEEKLVPYLGLTPVDVSDIKDIYFRKPALQRYEATVFVHAVLMYE